VLSRSPTVLCFLLVKDAEKYLCKKEDGRQTAKMLHGSYFMLKSFRRSVYSAYSKNGFSTASDKR